MYNVYNHWDKLKVCAVGRSYPPEFYSFINNPRLRSLFEKIAIETEEDYQGLINKLHEFGVETVRPNVPNIVPEKYYNSGLRIPGPISMNPRDQIIMIGEDFFIFPYQYVASKVSGRIDPHNIIDKVNNVKEWNLNTSQLIDWWKPIIEKLESNGSTLLDYSNKEDDMLTKALKNIYVNGITRIGRDLYFGTRDEMDSRTMLSAKLLVKQYLREKNYRVHYISTGGHVDGCFTPVKPGLIISASDMDAYDKSFPGWEVVRVSDNRRRLDGWYDLKKKNNGKWWIANSENDDVLIDFVESWLQDWIGYVDETSFDVNSLVIDEKNILVAAYNKAAFDAYERHGVTPHIVPLRHREFWDGGLSCITAELHREGVMQDWFPERG